MGRLAQRILKERAIKHRRDDPYYAFESIPFEIPHTFHAGSPGSGKSYAMLMEILVLLKACAEQGIEPPAIVVIDPHGNMGDAVAREYVQRGLGDRLVYDSLLFDEKVLALSSTISNYRKTTWFGELLHDDWAANALVECMMAQQQKETLVDAPEKKRWAFTLVRAALMQPVPLPLSRIPELANPKSEAYKQAVKCCTHAPTVRNLELMAGMSVTERNKTVESAVRMIEEAWCNPLFSYREGDIDLGELLSQRKTVIFSGDMGISHEAASGLFIHRIVQTVNYVLAKGEWVILVIDEAFNYHLMVPTLIRAMNMGRKKGLSVHIGTQHLPDEPKALRELLNVCGRHCWYGLMSWDFQMVAAYDCADLLDVMKVHHTEEIWTQVHDSWEYDERTEITETTSSSKIKDKAGAGTRITSGKSVKEVVDRIPKYGMNKREVHHYDPLESQAFQLGTSVGTQDVGHRFVRTRLGTKQEKVPSLNRSTFMERIMHERFLKWIAQQTIYRPVTRVIALPGPVDSIEANGSKNGHKPTPRPSINFDEGDDFRRIPPPKERSNGRSKKGGSKK